ncbi:CatA-like O-acetyltransferase [Oricola sp.]|uniref:CatA-like O-acetyltransferase n=1 Tax=Oricola sp. TaxID=1979950 RepID=UPI003BA8BDF4
MAAREIDLQSWPRAETYRLFRSYGKPHYAITSRIDVTRLVTELKPAGASPYRACLYAIGAGVHAVPELLTRFRSETVVQHDAVELSMTVPRDDGTFAYAYVPFEPDWPSFDRNSLTLMEAAAAAGGLEPNTGFRDDLAYLSCLPWLDFTAASNALPGPDDCIPRISWGRFVDDGSGRHSMAVAVEVHHALVDGIHLGQFFAAMQAALDGIPAS